MPYFDFDEEQEQTPAAEAENRRKVLGLIASAGKVPLLGPRQPVPKAEQPNEPPPVVGTPPFLSRPGSPATTLGSASKPIRPNVAPTREDYPAKPEVGGWKKYLGLGLATLAGPQTARPLAENILHGQRNKAEQNYQRGVQDWERGQTDEARAAQTENIRSEIRARDRTPEKPQPQPKTVETGEGVYQYNEDTGRYDIRVGGAKKTTPDKGTAEDLKNRIAVAYEKGDQAQVASLQKELEAIEKGTQKPPQEPGNYQPVTDTRGNTVGWVDPKSGHFRAVSSIPGIPGGTGGAPAGAIPRKPTGQEESRLAQAEVVTRAGNDLIGQIDKNRKSLGNIQAIINSAFLGTPLSDPVASGIAAQLASFAALNPAMHGFRGTDALREFEKLTGKIRNNPDSMIAAIRGILRTASAFSPQQTAPTGGFTPF